MSDNKYKLTDDELDALAQAVFAYQTTDKKVAYDLQMAYAKVMGAFLQDKKGDN